jgi:imidazolonepropionase-like amidohydrolase
MFKHFLLIVLLLILIGITAAYAQVTAIRAGNLIDPETGTISKNSIILIEQEKITEIGADLTIPADANVIDLSDKYVLPGLVDAHDHLALTYHNGADGGNYYLTTVLDGTPIRAIQAASNGIQKLASGFTVVRDLGNNGNYADVALRKAIEQGWLPGPTLIPCGIIIGGMGGQFWPTPERQFLV